MALFKGCRDWKLRCVELFYSCRSQSLQILQVATSRTVPRLEILRRILIRAWLPLKFVVCHYGQSGSILRCVHMRSRPGMLLARMVTAGSEGNLTVPMSLPIPQNKAS